jgi:hypothetical protein
MPVYWIHKYEVLTFIFVGSHWHWDHIGDPSRFPSSTELIVGPGFKAEFLPGYPARPDAPIRESDFA